MKYWDYSKEERENWRALEITQAYLAELREKDDDLVTQALNHALGNRAHEAVVSAATLEGIVHAIRVAEEET